MDIKIGSSWWGGNSAKFVVIGTMIIDGKEWVYYRSAKPKDDMPQEYSCYKESFLSRFTQLPE